MSEEEMTAEEKEAEIMRKIMNGEAAGDSPPKRQVSTVQTEEELMQKMLDGEITEEEAMGGGVKVSKSAWRKQGANQSKVDADMEARIMDGELLPDAIDDAGAPAEALTEEEMMQKIMDGGN